MSAFCLSSRPYNENRNKYLDFAKQLEKSWNIEMTVIQIRVIPLEKSSKAWKRNWENWRSTEGSGLSARITRRILETWRDLLSLKLQ